MKTKLSRREGQIIDVKWSMLVLNLAENWSLVTCIKNLGRIHVKPFKLSRPQCIIEVKCKKIALNRPFFFRHY